MSTTIITTTGKLKSLSPQEELNFNLEIAATEKFNELHQIIKSKTPASNSLLGGRLGMVLYYYSLYQAFDKPEYAEKSVALLEEVLHQMDTTSPEIFGNSFGAGGAGLGYVITTLHDAGLIEINLQDELELLDQFLFTSAMEQITKYDAIDYLHGAMGVVHYFTQRLPVLDKDAVQSSRLGNDVIKEYLQKLTGAICSKAIEEAEGNWFKNYVVDEKEKLEINLSLSHGLSGLLVLLTQAQEKIPVNPFLQHTIKEGIDFMLAQQAEVDFLKNKFSFFPSTINSANKKTKFFSPRLAWCYGDLNVLLAMYKTGALLEIPEWINRANLLGSATFMRKKLAEVGAADTHICHGTAGLAQFYKRLHEISHQQVYQTAWRHWIQQTLELLPSELQKGLYIGNECGLLTGLAGVNLALASFISKKELAWSKALLL
jgi:lantibiotic modifying enzyme